MRFWDALKIALHNLWQNKSRTVLTVVIVFVVSLLVMTLCFLGIAFTGNMNRLYLAMFDMDGTRYNLKPYSMKWEEGNNVSAEECAKLVEAAKRHPTVVDSVWVNGSRYTEGSFHPDYNRVVGEEEYWAAKGQVGVTPALYSFAFPLQAEGDYIAEGRVWTQTDCGTASVWVTDEYVGQLFETYGYALTVGQTIYLHFLVSDRITNENKVLSVPVTVRGVLDSAVFRQDAEYDVPTGNVFMDAQFAANAMEDAYPMSEINVCFTPIQGRYDFGKAEKEMKAFVREVNEAVGKGVDYEGKPTDRFRCGILDDLTMLRQIGALVIGVLVFLGFIILLLSIGSVANTIVISVDKNKKFIGLMKAMGLTQRGVMQIVRKEAVVTILIGIVLSTAALLLLASPVELLIGNILSSMVFGAEGLEFVVSAPLPPYLPFAALAVFVLMALLFSKSSLSRMAKMDVIAIISEVS